MDINSTKKPPIVKSINSVIDEETFFELTTFGTIALFCICVSGCFANVFNMAVFMKMGLQDSVNVSLFGMSLADFFNNMTSVAYAIYYNPWFIHHLDIPKSLLRTGFIVLVYPHVFFLKTTIVITAYVALERCLCVSMPLKVKLLFTPGRSKQVIIIAFLFNTLTTVLLLFCYRFASTFDPAQNASFFTVTNVPDMAGFFKALIYFNITFHYVGPYIFVSICTILLLTNLIKKSNWRKEATKSSTTTTTTSSNKDMKVAKMVVSVLILFIVFTFPSVLYKFALVFYGKQLRTTGPLYNLKSVLTTVMFIFDGINATCNTFVYYRSSSKYRETFQRMYFRNPNVEV